MSGGVSYDAHLDPWSLVTCASGEHLLFGFALHHPTTGGLAWLSSTEVLELGPDGDRALTRSGRRYRLGRRFDPLDIAEEGEEARVVFDTLLGSEFEQIDALRLLDRTWVACCKAARHLSMTPPSRTRSDVAQFIALHLRRYYAMRSQREMP